MNASFEFVAVYVTDSWQLGLVKMNRYTIEQRVCIGEHHLKNNECLVAAVRKYRTKYDRNGVLISSHVKTLIKIRNTGSIGDTKPTSCSKRSRSNVLMKCNRICIKWSWKILTKECSCASIVKASCPVYYSINNPILCTF